jgi:hypothetical protein
MSVLKREERERLSAIEYSGEKDIVNDLAATIHDLVRLGNAMQERAHLPNVGGFSKGHDRACPGCVWERRGEP